ncbi:MAG: hypothetical protein D6722_23310, partial [Bacteroidetes bacterium]
MLCTFHFDFPISFFPNSTTLDALKRVFKSLSRTERRYLKNYLAAFHSRGKNRALELVELMEAQPDMSYADMAEKMYGDRRSKAFLMLKSRVLEKTLETLSLSVNFQNNPTYQEDPAFFEQMEVRKEMIYATLLRRRGLEEAAIELIRKNIDRAARLGLTDLELHGYVLLRNMCQSPTEMRETLSPAVDAALEAYRTDLLGVEIMDASRMVEREQQVFNEVLNNFWATEIPRLEERLETHPSLRAQYYALFMKARLYEGREDHVRARETLGKLIDWLKAHPGISSRNRLGVPYLQLATVEMVQHDFAAARRAAEQARDCFPPQRSNYLKASIPLIFACIYGGDLATASQAITDIEKTKTPEYARGALTWLRYLDSCVAFCQGDLRRAYDALGDVNTLFSHKEIWNTN